MNPNSGEGYVNFEAAPDSGETQEKLSNSENRPSTTPENKAQQQKLVVNSQAASDLAQSAQAISIPDDTTVQSVVDNTNDASDTDRIESIWIDKTREVISRTLDDPFEQKKEMSRVKAEYIQKRFKKTIKTDETNK